MFTIAIISHNRAKYLRALLVSLNVERLVAARVQIIVVDNCSSEQDIRVVLEDERINSIIRTSKPDWINDEYIAKNIAISIAKFESILFLQDDMQYLFDADTLIDAVKDFHNMNIQSLSLTAGRYSTTEQSIDTSDLIRGENMIVYPRRDDHVCTTGLFRKHFFDRVGEYCHEWPVDREYWGRSEDEYNHRAHEIFQHEKISFHAKVPLFLSVWNDPRGGYAIIRDGKRHGHYIDADNSSNLYYELHTKNDWINMNKSEKKKFFTFVDLAKPICWEYKKDVNGEQFKFPQNLLIVEGPNTSI